MKFLSAIAAVFIAVPCLAKAANPAPECAGAIKACQDAGFIIGDHKDKKGLWIDCIGEIANGKKLKKVKLSQSNAAACMAAQKGKKRK